MEVHYIHSDFRVSNYPKLTLLVCLEAHDDGQPSSRSHSDLDGTSWESAAEREIQEDEKNHDMAP